MKHDIIYLKEENRCITLKTYISEDEPEIGASPRDAVIVIPGGAYFFLSDREGEPVVKKFFAEGFNCFLLHYSIHPHAAFPTPLQDVSRAIIHIKEHAEEYNVNPERIFVCGFSAGGHLAASIGTMWDSEEAKPWDNMPYGQNKPCGMILCYPWITLDAAYRHKECAENVCGGEITPEGEKMWSAERRVSESTVPAYIWTTATDTCVHPMNSMLMAEALFEHNIPCELHVFKAGPHGMALCNEQTAHGSKELIYPDCATWIDEAIEWARNTKEELTK